jgi:hypothetical protein
MRQSTFVDENHLDDRVVRDVDLMRAHAVGATVSRSIITVAELFGRNVVDLRERRRRRKRERDLIHKGNHVVAGRRDCEQQNMVINSRRELRMKLQWKGISERLPRFKGGTGKQKEREIRKRSELRDDSSETPCTFRF